MTDGPESMAIKSAILNFAVEVLRKVCVEKKKSKV